MEYVEAIGRNPGEEHQHSHLYVRTDNGELLPMCIYGWNRSNGEGFSIFRGHKGSKGLCKICHKRRMKNKGPKVENTQHKTKWL